MLQLKVAGVEILIRLDVSRANHAERTHKLGSANVSRPSHSDALEENFPLITSILRSHALRVLRGVPP